MNYDGITTKEILDSISAPAGDCREVQSRRNHAGYGRICIRGKRIMAHRLAYELAHGPIPDGFIVRHKCDNPPCINPDHLELGTDADNMRDRVARLTGPRGKAVRTTKLTEAQVHEVRQRVGNGEARRSVARSLGVSHTAINDLVNGKNWRHVKGTAQWG